MDLHVRRRFTLGVALVSVLALIGWWAMRLQDAANTSAADSGQVAATASSPDLKSPASPDSEANVAADPRQPDSAFGSFRGRVIDAVARMPVRTFEVRFLGARAAGSVLEPPGSRKFEAPDGRFEWQRLPPGDWHVAVSAPGFQRFELVNMKIGKGLSTPEIVLPLLRGHEVRGRVYDEASGQGIAAASISFREAGAGRFEGNFRSRSRGTSASDGSFVLDGLPPGRMTLDVSAQDYADRDFDVVVESQMSPVDIALCAGGAITGRLTDVDGVTPVAGYVGLWDVDDHFGVKHLIGASGEFKFEHLSAGPYHVTGEVEGREAITRQFVLAKNERMDGVVLALVEGRRIRGTIVGLHPDDLKRVRVFAQRDARQALVSDIGLGEDGAYEFRGVQPGRVVLVANAPARQISKTIDMPADSDITVNLEFPPGVHVSGRVTRGGRPLVDVDVTPRPAVRESVYSYGTSTSNDGEYSLADLVPGEYTFFVEGHTTAPLQISRDTVFDIDIPLPQFSGRVLEEQAEVPVVAAFVQLWPAEPGSSGRSVGTGSDHFGRFSLSGLEPGDYMVAAHKPGYEMYRNRVSYSSPASGLTIRLRQDPGVAIRVRAAPGSEPLQEIRVIEMNNGRGGSWMQVQLDKDGKGLLPSALTGSTLSFRAVGHAERIVREWSGQSIDVQLTRKKAQ